MPSASGPSRGSQPWPICGRYLDMTLVQLEALVAGRPLPGAPVAPSIPTLSTTTTVPGETTSTTGSGSTTTTVDRASTTTTAVEPPA